LNFCVVNPDLTDCWHHSCKYLCSTSYTVHWPCGCAPWSKSIKCWNATAIVTMGQLPRSTECISSLAPAGFLLENKKVYREKLLWTFCKQE